MHAVRWLLLPPLMASGWCCAVLAAVLFGMLLDRLCPPDAFVSGMCLASWHRSAELVCDAVAAALGAGLSVALPALAAPAHRPRVAKLAFAAGCLAVLVLLSAVGLSIAIPAASAAAAGLLVASRFAPARAEPHDIATRPDRG